MKIASMLDYLIEFCSFLFLQRSKSSNLASKNKEVVGVALQILGTVWWLSSRGHPTVCLGLPCKVLNQSIVGLSPLSETTYSTSHQIPNDGS
jgi:hypothetical protein